MGHFSEEKLVCAAVEEFIHHVYGEKDVYHIVNCAKHGQKLVTMDVTRQNRESNRRGRRLLRGACGITKTAILPKLC